VARADDHLVVFHPARAPGVTVEENRVAVRVAKPGEEAIQRRIVRIVERLQSLLEVGEPERAGEDGHVSHGMGAHHAAPRAHVAVVMLEVVAAAIDVDEHAGERRCEDGRAVLVKVRVDVAGEGIRKAVGKGLEPRLTVIVAGDVGQGTGAVVRHAHEDGRPGPLRGAPDDREGLTQH
jgi:hypothetical protein